MNLILLQFGELDDGRVCLEDWRAGHILNVLHARVGQRLRVGLENGPKGQAQVDALDEKRVWLQCRFDPSPPPLPRLDLLLALPRPKVLKRLWAQLAAMGVGRIILTNAAKVERPYFDTHWLDPERYGPLLREGLMQAGDTRVPAVQVERRLKPFLEDACDALCPDHVRLLAHPRDAAFLGGLTLDPGRRVLLAVGPEGGWTEYELGLFARQGFERIHIGSRTLRTDTACIALLGALKIEMGS